MRVYSSTRTAAIIIGLPIYLISYHYDVKRYKIFFRLFTEGKPSLNNLCSASLARLSCFALRLFASTGFTGLFRIDMMERNVKYSKFIYINFVYPIHNPTKINFF